MKNTKTIFLSFIFALVFIALPGFMQAEELNFGRTYVVPGYGDTSNGSASFDPNYTVSVPDSNDTTNRTYTYTKNKTVVDNSTQTTSSNGSGRSLLSYLGISSKSQAERNAEEAAKLAAEKKAQEEAMLYRNSDGSFAYGYGNDTYGSDVRYVDARNTRSVRYTASAANSVYTNRNVASASVASGGFLPTSFFGWVVVLFLLSVFVIVLRRLVNQYYTKETVIIHK